MKILLISGHGGGDPGAIGNHNGVTYREADLTREVTAWVASNMLRYCDVDIYPTDRNAFQDALNNSSAVNFRNYDYVLEVHFNALMASTEDGLTKGTEIYVTNYKRQGVTEQALVDNLAACGLQNRGIKINPFKVIATIERTGTPAALLEVCFVDDPDDMKVYNTKFKEIIRAIVRGLVTGLGLTSDGKEELMENFIDVLPDDWYAEDVAYVTEHNLMQGMGNGRFDPDSTVTRAQLAAVAARLHRAISGNASDNQ